MKKRPVLVQVAEVFEWRTNTNGTMGEEMVPYINVLLLTDV